MAPHTPVRVVLFGSFLDDIALVGFTPSENCSQTLMNIHQEDFTIQTERRIVIIYEFEEFVSLNILKPIICLFCRSKSIYKICLKQKVGSDVYELPFSLVRNTQNCLIQFHFPLTGGRPALLGVYGHAPAQVLLPHCGANLDCVRPAGAFRALLWPEPWLDVAYTPGIDTYFQFRFSIC